MAEKFKDGADRAYVLMHEVTSIELVRNCEGVVRAPLPLSPDGVQQLAWIVVILKDALRHYWTHTPSEAKE